MNKINKISMTVLAVVALITSSVMAVDVVNEGTFDTDADTHACWASDAGGWTDAANVSPISGGYIWFNGPGRQWDQAFDGITLMPNTIYKVSFDAITLANANTIDVGLLYMTGSSNTSAASGYIAAADVLNFENDTTWSVQPNVDWVTSGRFTLPLAPGADDPLSSHYFQFNTPAVLNGPANKIGVDIRNAIAVQIRLDNVVVDVTPIPEPATIGLLSILGFALLRRK